MSMNNDRLEKLRSLLQTVNESITKQEFVTSFKAVLDFVKQIDAKNTAEFDNFKVQFKHLANSLKLDTEGELDDLKTKVDSTLKDCMAEMMVEHDAKLQAMDKKMSELRDGLDGVDGKDADEHKVMEMVLAKIPPLELEPLDVVEKLESLQGEYRLDASAIKNLPEGKGSSWRGGGSRYLRNLADVTLTNLADGEAIVWDTTTGQFINSAVASSGVDTANSPQANEFARFTDADTIEGRTTSEVLSDLGFTASITELNYTDGVTSAIQDQINAKANSSGALTQFVGNTAWRVFYSDANGDITELALGADGTFLKSNGASAAPTFAVPAGSGDVTKVGTPLNNQVGVWTGDGTIEGDADLTFDTTTNTLATGVLQSSTLTASEIVITDGSKNLVSAAVATYPSLTELTYLKGVTSALQTQLNAKQGLDTQLTDLAGLSYAGNSLKVVRVNVGETGFELATLSGGTLAIGDTITSATAGSIFFAGVAGVLAQDNTNFFWDDTNNNLKLGNPSLVSTANLNVKVTTGNSYNLFLEGTGGVVVPTIGFKHTTDSTGVALTGNDSGFAFSNIGEGQTLFMKPGYPDAYWKTHGSSAAKFHFQSHNGSSYLDSHVITSGWNAFGHATPDRLMHAEVADSGTNAVVYASRTSHVTSGTATTGFGIGEEFELENASGTNRVVATQEYAYSDATNASEDVTFKLRLMVAGTLTDAITVLSTGATTFAGDVTVPDEAYGTGWNGSLEVPTKNALYDKIETLGGGSGITRTVVTTSGSLTLGATASTDYIYFVAGAHTLSMPSPNTNRYTVKNLHSAAITIDTAGAETIEGAASISLQPNDSVDILSDGTNWFVH